MKSPKYAGESMKRSDAARSEAKGASPGHVYPKMTAGAASGMGRMEKAKAYGDKAKGK